MKELQRLSQMDPDVAPLLRAVGERRASPGAKQRLLSSLFPLGAPVLAASGASAAAAMLGPKAWLVICVVTATAAGGGAVALRSQPVPSPVSARVVAAAAPAPAAAPPAEAGASQDAVILPPVRLSSQPSATAAPAAQRHRLSARPSIPPPSEVIERAPTPSVDAPAAPTPALLMRELSLLDTAQQAVRQREHARALFALDRYDQTFPDGALRDEARALRVAALAQAGRLSEARAAGERFLKSHPHSVLAARVAKTLSDIAQTKETP